MKKIIYKLSFFALALISLSACSEDFITREPIYGLNTDNAITNKASAESAIRGMYSTIRADVFGGSLACNYASKSGFVNWSTPSSDMDYSQTNESTTTTVPWTQYYESVNFANYAIQGISKLTDESVISTEERINLIAEVRCFRGFVNATILWSYGHWWSNDDDNIYGLLYRDELADLSNLQQARLTVGESYTKIYEDLDYAIANMGDFKGNRYFSKTFAKILKAKLILFRSGYNDSTEGLDVALALVNDILNNGPAGFSMDSDMAQVYEDSWDSEESVFSVYLEDDGDRTDSSGSWYRYSVPREGDELPLDVGVEPTAGLAYGADWFRADPRWDIVTGDCPQVTTSGTDTYTWTKVTRLGDIQGELQGDEKYTAYFFRYPELYIMKAELIARTGASISEAIAPINLMRSKRTNPVLPSLNPTTQEELDLAIFQEYFFETFLENGSEYFASLRFKIEGQLWIAHIRSELGFDPFDITKVCYPIPSDEVQFNLEMIQNLGLE